MAYYRLYYMRRFDGHIDQFRDFGAADDEAALGVAEGWRTAQPMELWNLHRKLRRWDEESQEPAKSLQ